MEQADSPVGQRKGLGGTVRTLLGLAVGGSFLYLSLRGIDRGAVWAALRSIDAAWLPPLLALLLTGFVVRSLRWRWMFAEQDAPTLREAFDAFMIGAMGNNLLPGRLGDLLRAAVLGRHLPRVGTGGALASIVLEKVLDGLVLLGLLGAALALAPLPGWIASAGLWGIAVFGTALVLLLALNATGTSTWLARRAQDGKPMRLVHTLVQRLRNGLHGLRTPRQAARLGAASLAVWALESLVLYLSLRMFGLELPLEAAVVTIVLLSVGTMLPAAPGFLGTYQFFVVTALTLYQVPQETALALGLLLNLLVIVTTTATGMLAVLMEGGLARTLLLRRAAVSASSARSEPRP